MTTILQALEQKLQPKYIGWKDQYKAILYILCLDPDEDMNSYLQRLPEGD